MSQIEGSNSNPQNILFPQMPPAGNLSPPRFTLRSIVLSVLLHIMYLLIGLVFFVVYEHFKIHGRTGLSLACLIAAAGFGLAPLRRVGRAVFAIEARTAHLLHGIGGLLMVILTFGGVVSGGPVLTRSALAPFAIMGAVQAMTHQHDPRSQEQDKALRRFVESIPEAARLVGSGNLTSPESSRRAIAALSEVIARAETLGETELRSDPGFQSALKRVSMRFGLSLGLDTVDMALDKLSKNPAMASSVPSLRKRLAKARNTINRE